MRDSKIINMEDLSDSREIMMRRTPRYILFFVIFLIIVVVTGLLWTYFGKIDIYVTAMGEIRPDDDMSTITLMNGGKIAAIKYKNGEKVTEGESILTLDNAYYLEQKVTMEENIQQDKDKIEKYDLLINGIKNDINPFTETEDPSFYYSYRDYEIRRDSSSEKIERSNTQIYSSAEEINLGLEQAISKKEETVQLHKNYKEVYENILNDTEYVGDDNSMQILYQNYRTSLDRAQAIYDSANLTYETLRNEYEKQNPEETEPGEPIPAPMENVTKEQVEQALFAKNEAEAELNGVKDSVLLQLDETLQSLEGQIKTYEDNIDTYSLKKEGLIYDDTLGLTVEEIKNSYFVSIDGYKKQLQDEIKAYENNIKDIEETLKNLEIKAERDGVLQMNQEYVSGDVIAAGTIVARIIPETERYRVELYISERDIAEIQKGQKVEFTFSAISSTDYGKIYGEITEISADSSYDSVGNKFFQAFATIEKTKLNSKDGDERTIQMGMLTEAHIITGSQRILFWIFDKVK